MHITGKNLSNPIHVPYNPTFTVMYSQTNMQHTRGMETTRHRSLVERGGRKALLETLHTQQKQNVRKNPIFTKDTSSFQQSYSTISYEVIKATSINHP